MKQSRKVLLGQTLLDIAAQELGDSSRAIEVAVLNNISITDDLLPGSILLLPEPNLKVKDIITVFLDSANLPASADIAGELKLKDEGVEFWKIEKDFIIQ